MTTVSRRDDANPAMFQVFVSQLALPRFHQFVQMVEKAQARGEIRQDLDLQLVTDLLIGPILFRWMVTNVLLPSPTQADLASFTEQMTDLVLHCLGIQSSLTGKEEPGSLPSNG